METHANHMAVFLAVSMSELPCILYLFSEMMKLPGDFVIPCREEEGLVSDYTLVLLSVLLDCHRAKFSTAIATSISHLTRILAAKHMLFLKPSNSRLIPR